MNDFDNHYNHVYEMIYTTSTLMIHNTLYQLTSYYST